MSKCLKVWVPCCQLEKCAVGIIFFADMICGIHRISQKLKSTAFGVVTPCSSEKAEGGDISFRNVRLYKREDQNLHRHEHKNLKSIVTEFVSQDTSHCIS
jgi:hypothetical protein